MTLKTEAQKLHTAYMNEFGSEGYTTEDFLDWIAVACDLAESADDLTSLYERRATEIRAQMGRAR